MKSFWKEIATALLLTLLVPGLMLNTARLFGRNSSEPVESLPEIKATEPTDSAVASGIRVVMENGSVVFMELEAYLVGVVLGEMPADFEPEALKAQAVVARTYTLRMCRNTAKHPEADVCIRSDCCQSYRTGEDYLAGGGTQMSVDKIRDAVESTAGQVLTYNGQLIEATYFSSAGGRTEDALAVWGSDVPYLRSTDSPEDGYADQYLETVTITAEEFENALGIPLDGPCETWLGTVAYTNGGGVDTMVIGDTTFRGTDLRKLLGLRSTAFVMTAVGDHITVTTRGFGHRVGMSQYGAEAMAVDGATYQEILAHYYQGTTLEEFVDKDSSMG